MPIVQPDGNKVPENCCAKPSVTLDEECSNCGYLWEDEENWEPA